jgi:hypothetical protein
MAQFLTQIYLSKFLKSNRVLTNKPTVLIVYPGSAECPLFLKKGNETKFPYSSTIAVSYRTFCRY